MSQTPAINEFQQFKELANDLFDKVQHDLQDANQVLTQQALSLRETLAQVVSEGLPPPVHQQNPLLNQAKVIAAIEEIIKVTAVLGTSQAGLRILNEFVNKQAEVKTTTHAVQTPAQPSVVAPTSVSVTRPTLDNIIDVVLAFVKPSVHLLGKGTLAPREDQLPVFKEDLMYQGIDKLKNWPDGWYNSTRQFHDNAAQLAITIQLKFTEARGVTTLAPMRIFVNINPNSADSVQVFFLEGSCDELRPINQLSMGVLRAVTFETLQYLQIEASKVEQLRRNDPNVR